MIVYLSGLHLPTPLTEESIHDLIDMCKQVPIVAGGRVVVYNAVLQLQFQRRSALLTAVRFDQDEPPLLHRKYCGLILRQVCEILKGANILFGDWCLC